MDNGVIQTRIDILEKAIRLDPGNTALTHEMDELIKGGKKGGVGEIRDWNGKKYQKRMDGKWRPVKKETQPPKPEQKKGEEGPNIKLTGKKPSGEDYDKEWVEGFLKKVRNVLYGVTLNPSQGDLSKLDKVKKVIQNMDDFPEPEMKVVERELRKLGFDINGDKIKHPVEPRQDPKQSEITIKGKPWEFDKRAMENFSKEERDQVVEMISGGYRRVKNIPGNSSKVDINPGESYSIEQFSNSLSKTSSEAGKKKFIKDNGEGYYSYAIQDSVTQTEVENLILGIGDNLNLYNYFNKNFKPFDISRKELFQITEKVESSNIYSTMAADQYKVEEISFKVNVNSGKPPVTITSRIVRDSTLSTGDIVSFM